MKIIEFKGKLKASQEWAYGNLCKRIDGGYIVTPDETPIGKYGAIQEGTESQYTGINDIEGNKIFENDILEMTEEGRILFGSDNHPCSKYQLVGFHDGCFMTSRNEIAPKIHYDTYLWIIKDYVKVVGNKFDNKEILNMEGNKIWEI